MKVPKLGHNNSDTIKRVLRDTKEVINTETNLPVINEEEPQLSSKNDSEKKESDRPKEEEIKAIMF